MMPSQRVGFLLLSWEVVTCSTLPVDIRIAKGLKDRGYSAVRISAVDRGELLNDPFFDYSERFIGAWKQYYIHSTVKEVNGSNTFEVGGQNIRISLPREGGKVRGLLFADPCISSAGGMFCNFKDQFKTKERLATILNQFVGSDEIDFWGIIGDNFYESNQAGGHITKSFFETLSLQAKSKPLMTVPGNHDFWISGGPPGQTSIDQFGYGFMQMYGQDTVASLSGSHKPFDFSVPPVSGKIPIQDNFVFSHQIGDAAFFGFSGAHTQEQLAPHVQSFCRWLANASTVNTAVVLGHWNTENLGCTRGMAAPDVFEAARSMPGCESKNLLFVDGHEHCNNVHARYPGRGFLIGGNGMGGNCPRQQFGFMVLESDPHAYNGPNVRVDYFELASLSTKERTLTSTDELDAVKAAMRRWSNELVEEVNLSSGTLRKGFVESYRAGRPGAQSEEPTPVRRRADLPEVVGPHSELKLLVRDVSSDWDALQACIKRSPGRPYTSCRGQFSALWRAPPEPPTTMTTTGGGSSEHRDRWDAVLPAVLAVLTVLVVGLLVARCRRQAPPNDLGRRLHQEE